jgi:uncharacterized protein YecE (DUF72 family)
MTRLCQPSRTKTVASVHRDLLSARDGALVTADRAPGVPTPWVEPASWAYLRFHRGRRRNGGYTGAQLEAWADRIAAAPGDVYAYFNNDWEGLAVDDALALRALLATDDRFSDVAGVEHHAS